MNNKMRDHDVLYFGCVEWSLFQRPQSLALEFAKRGCRVFYVEPMLSVGSILYNQYKGKALRLSRPDNLFLLKPILSLSTFRSGVTKSIDKYLFSLWFERIRAKYQLRNHAIIFMNLPYWWGNILGRNLFPNSTVIYDCCDDCRVHSRNSRILKRMERSERKLAGEADLCLTTSDALYEKMKQFNSSTYLVPNAVNPMFFIENSRQSPPDVEHYERPVYGFIGSLYDHIDFDIILALSKLIKKGTIVLVGYTNRMAELKKLTDCSKNIVYLGPRPYQMVPAYIRSFDVCLIPYKVGGRIDTVNPVKLNEYLIFGKPVLGLRTYETAKYSKYVYLYNECNDLGDLIERALAEKGDDSIRQERVKFALNNTWEIRVDQIEKILESML